mmetsp:Transcript_3790/g.8568  ORF Transcript_3790/g.8568 Transcript_3790/m.8568 type:complete len:80 (+) Transcript_3790:48-287(+)
MDDYDPKTKTVAALFSQHYLVMIATLIFLVLASSFLLTSSSPSTFESIFDFSVDTVSGTKSLSGFKGKKAYLLVNVASK